MKPSALVLSLGRTVTTHNHPTRYWETFIIDGVNLIATSHGATQEESQEIATLLRSAPELLAKLLEADRLIMQLATVIVNTKIEDHVPFELKERTEEWLRDGATTVLNKAAYNA